MNIIKTEEYIKEKLSKGDSKLSAVINSIGYIEINLEKDYFLALCRSIVGQQLSNKVADVIWNRVLILLENEVEPEKILATEDEELRSKGVSYSKIKYIKNLSLAVVNKEIHFEKFDDMSDEEIIKELTKVKGIGTWTAEMFLIFSLGREDVFSLGDAGLKSVIKNLYEFENEPTKLELTEISSRWSPYRTYASLYLWEMINRKLI